MHVMFAEEEMKKKNYLFVTSVIIRSVIIVVVDLKASQLQVGYVCFVMNRIAQF